jgi:hypothetical protein
MSSSKKCTCKVADVYLSEAQNPLSPPHMCNVHACKQYTYSHREGGRGGRVNKRED